MKLAIGIDTGGTYTDAVLLDLASGRVIKKAKAITTPHDLSIGIAQALDGFGEFNNKNVKTVAISTTLATNAIVEGQGGRVALLLIGYDEDIMQRAGFSNRLPVEAISYIGGGHNVKGDEVHPLDHQAALLAIQRYHDQVDAFGVSGYFSVMNPEHELSVRKIIQELTDKPVVCGHELTNKLNALKRVSTVVLNARLLPLIQHLLDSVKKVLEEKDIHAPLMVMKGDGTLINEETARVRPVETILSGPAASAIGAEFLSNQSDAIVIDMGGTTTDIAILEDGWPLSNPAGATIGGWQTCVQAANLHTIGIGGDSYIRIEKNRDLKIGPNRAIPLFRFGDEWPEVFQEIKNVDSGSGFVTSQPLGFLTLVHSPNGITLNPDELSLVTVLQKSPLALNNLSKSVGIASDCYQRLEMLGIVRRAGLTPTDVFWSRNKGIGGNKNAAYAGTSAVAKQLQLTDDQFSDLVMQQIVDSITRELLNKIVRDNSGSALFPAPIAWETLLDCMLGKPRMPNLSGKIFVNKPIVAIGAPVANFIPAVADRLHTTCFIPQHAEVGNAVGAAVASISHTVEVLVQPNVQGSDTLTYLVHSSRGRVIVNSLEEAIKLAETTAAEIATQTAHESGAELVTVEIDKQYVSLGVLTEVTVRASATNKAKKVKKSSL